MYFIDMFLEFDAGIPCFLANAAITSWIKFEAYTTPAIMVTVLQGLAVLYLVTSHARWVKHILGKPARNHPQVSVRSPHLTPIPLFQAPCLF